jgi:peptidoglycan/LPS O-acetylase OafA/YrhL
MRQGSDRYQYLDGLRGIACLMVVAGHYNEAFQPPQTPQMLKPYYDGGLAVGIFFLMSGFVLTGSFSKGHYSIKRLLASRMFRLLVPGIIAICMASVLFFVLSVGG